MTDIVTLPAFKAYVNDQSNGLNDDTMQAFLDAAIEVFANLTQRNLTLVDGSTVASNFTLAADPYCSILRIPDCTSITSITENGATVATSDWQAEPVNAELTGAFRPYTQVRRLRGGYWYSDYGRAAIVVNAKWGWSAFPSDFAEAIKVLGKELCNNQDVRLGIVAATEGAFTGARTNKVVRDAINFYARPETIGV